jgi:hypothetical protein
VGTRPNTSGEHCAPPQTHISLIMWGFSFCCMGVHCAPVDLRKTKWKTCGRTLFTLTNPYLPDNVGVRFFVVGEHIVLPWIYRLRETLCAPYFTVCKINFPVFFLNLCKFSTSFGILIKDV